MKTQYRKSVIIKIEFISRLPFSKYQGNLIMEDELWLALCEMRDAYKIYVE